MENAKTVISIIIPVYKCEKYIGACIESVLAQTYPQFELILVDDGSPDSASEICDQYAQKDDRIQVIHKENGGVSSARNAGLAVAKGEYVSFIDSDDYIDEAFLQTLLNYAKKTQADLVASGLKMEFWKDLECIQREEYFFRELKQYDVKALLEGWGVDFPPICVCGPCCKLYRRSIILERNITFAMDLNCGEDTLFNLNFLENCSKICAIPMSFYHYRRENGESLFSRFHKDTYEIHRRVYTKQYELIAKYQCNKATLMNFRRMYFAMMIGGIHEFYRFYEKTTREEKKELLKTITADPYIKQVKVWQLSGSKNKIFRFLFHVRGYELILWLFDRHYKK